MGRIALRGAALFVLLTAMPFVTTAGGAKDPFEAMAVQRPAAPSPAPELVFTTLDGREARLSDLRGKVIVLGFFTTT